MRRPMLALQWESLQSARVAFPHLLAATHLVDRGLLFPASAGLQAQPTFGHRMAVDVQAFSVATSWADALSLYLDTLTQPPQWNAWQSVAYSLTRLYDEEFDQLGRNDVAAMISSKYHEMMPLVFGSSWRALRSQVPGAWRFNGSPPPAVGRGGGEAARDAVHTSPPTLTRSVSPQAVTQP